MDKISRAEVRLRAAVKKYLDMVDERGAVWGWATYSELCALIGGIYAKRMSSMLEQAWRLEGADPMDFVTSKALRHPHYEAVKRNCYRLPVPVNTSLPNVTVEQLRGIVGADARVVDDRVNGPYVERL